MIHSLVLAAFAPNAEPWWVCNHLDTDPANPHLENLEWTTQLGNLLHSAKLGKRVWQRKSLDIPTILALWAEGFVITDIARKLGIGYLAVRRVMRGEHWQQRDNQDLLPKSPYVRRKQTGIHASQSKTVDLPLVLVLRQQGLPKSAIARIVGVTPNTIRVILTNQHWSQRVHSQD